MLEDKLRLSSHKYKPQYDIAVTGSPIPLARRRREYDISSPLCRYADGESFRPENASKQVIHTEGKRSISPYRFSSVNTTWRSGVPARARCFAVRFVRDT